MKGEGRGGGPPPGESLAPPTPFFWRRRCWCSFTTCDEARHKPQPTAYYALFLLRFSWVNPEKPALR